MRKLMEVKAQVLDSGGGMNDHEAIAACNELGISRMFTGEWAFSHH